MTTVCFGGVEKNIPYVVYEEEGEYIAEVGDNRESLKTETFPEAKAAKKWVNRMLDVCCRERNEIDRIV
jgi:hypothetical protein